MESSTLQTTEPITQIGAGVVDGVKEKPTATNQLSSTPLPVVANKVQDPNFVGYDGPNDRENPKNWSLVYKWSLMAILCALSVTTNLTILVCAPAIPSILKEFNSSSELYSSLIVSIWNLGAVVGCLILGPLAEIYGRLLVYNIANFFFLVLLIASTLSKSIDMLIVLRCLNGLSVATTSLNPSIVGDLFVTEERGLAQSILAVMPLLGPVIGPIMGGYVAENLGWRWTFGITSILLGVFAIVFAALYRETYEATILRRKAKRLRKESGNELLHSQYDHTLPLFVIIRNAFSRPIRLFAIPIFVLVAFAASMLVGYVYIIATSITEVFQNAYGFSEGKAGLTFLGSAFGMTVGSIFCSIVLDWYTKRMKKLNDGVIKPEWRLTPTVMGFVLAPLGLFLYGWTLPSTLHLSPVLPLTGTFLLGFAAYTVTIPTTTYLVDIFGIYCASAMSALTMIREECMK
ncbi:hypothetical protein G7Y89_g7614 [Cudoniella acicularis]|uniref:Major facilitator superfamily (MFS) profile domain-containing protein n=1 Tax=Cudoniella acicularis TaxID=354080 RepID=A0A8H4RJR3_9HELO|nr:hypothetical protein G7Y89_g7614 [Cudoniella acicularis]